MDRVEVGRGGWIVGRDDAAGAVCSRLLQPGQHPFRPAGVLVPCRLVRKEEARCQDERPRERCSLLLSDRRLHGEAGLEVLEAEVAEELSETDQPQPEKARERVRP